MRTTTRREVQAAVPEMTMGPDAEDPCEHCSHTWGDHILGAENPTLGGIWWCPVDECDCHGTWDVPQLGQRNN